MNSEGKYFYLKVTQPEMFYEAMAYKSSYPKIFKSSLWVSININSSRLRTVVCDFKFCFSFRNYTCFEGL